MVADSSPRLFKLVLAQRTDWERKRPRLHSLPQDETAALESKDNG